MKIIIIKKAWLGDRREDLIPQVIGECFLVVAIETKTMTIWNDMIDDGHLVYLSTQRESSIELQSPPYVFPWRIKIVMEFWRDNSEFCFEYK